MPYRIPPAFLDKLWGSKGIEPWFAPRPGLLGEVWFQTEPPLSLLTKFIFTSDRLSVQVHPDDAQARQRGLENGKTEMWHVLRADPGTTIALGFRHEITLDHARAAALSGEIVDLLDWIPVHAGDTFFVNAGTVHAIGAGIALCEIQQNSDTTYRLYDYGRDRKLHLTDGFAVSHLYPWRPQAAPQALDEAWTRLVTSQYFETDLGLLSVTHQLPPAGAYRLLVILEGAGLIAGQPYNLGECWLIDAAEPSVALSPSAPTRILRTGPPSPLLS
ncbi:MAG TPA: class I mannose-6-phosphate isomerase [Paludibaculum sp.]|jgi:mannose-6-phosphate isomerase